MSTTDNVLIAFELFRLKRTDRSPTKADKMDEWRQTTMPVNREHVKRLARLLRSEVLFRVAMLKVVPLGVRFKWPLRL